MNPRWIRARSTTPVVRPGTEALFAGRSAHRFHDERFLTSPDDVNVELLRSLNAASELALGAE